MNTSIPSRAIIQLDFTKLKRLVLIGLICLIALIPLFLLVKILVTAGTDSISNDYIRFTKLADRVLSEGYDWRWYFKDTLDNNVHSYAFLFPVRLVLAELTHLSVMAEIYVGLAITFVNLLLLFSILTRFIGSTSPLRFLLLPVLSAFIFSYSQISTYSFGETALQMGFTHLGILVGLWMLLLRSQSFFTPWVMLICGILSSFSGGSGLLGWPVFLLAILITNTGSLNKYIIWLVGLGIGASPYLAFSNYSTFNGAFNLFNILTINKIVTGLGLPLANNINYGIQEHYKAFLAGLIGVGILLFAGLLLFLCRSKRRFQIAIPPLLLIFWGILGSLQIAASRDLLAPWYTSTYILFWIGLLGLCFAMIQPDVSSPKRKFYFFHWDKIIQIAGFAGLFGMTLLYLITNHTYEDKSFYLASRSPTSAACLRNYQIAPTYCEGFIFQWGVGNPSFLPQMASILDKYHWSVLGPHQEWTLQGDYILGNVSLISSTGLDEIRWVVGSLDEPSFWTDFHHLNLLLSPGQSIYWLIDLPQNLNNAQFQMGLSLTEKATCNEQNLSISFESPSDSKKSIFQQKALCNFVNESSISENLLAYAGKSMVIRITNDNNPIDGKAVRLHYPRVLLDENPPVKQDKFTPPTVRPLNTDLSPNFLPLNAAAINLQILTTSGPELQDLVLQNSDGLMIGNGQNPRVRYTPVQPICLSNWSRFYFNLALTDSVPQKKVKIGFQFRDDQGITRESFMDFPLLAGENLHAYTLDLEILNMPTSACITSLDFQLLEGSNNALDQWVQISEVGFLPRTNLRFGFFQ